MWERGRERDIRKITISRKKREDITTHLATIKKIKEYYNYANKYNNSGKKDKFFESHRSTTVTQEI